MADRLEGSTGIPGSIGKYEVLGRIARGGMAEVFLGRIRGQAGAQRLVAIKRILPHMTANKSFVEMFIDEARISAQLNHSHIGRIYDFGLVDDAYFIAMEYVEGLDLRSIGEHLEKSQRRMPVPMAAYIVSCVCGALDHAHGKTDSQGNPLNIIHRDVSPTNVLVGFEGEVKLIDFGIARAAQRLHETRAPTIKGKLAYLAPEQATGKQVDRRTDLYGAGVLLYELLTGQQVFSGTNDLVILDKVRQGVTQPPSALVGGIPAELERICMRALATKPDGRFQSGGEMQTELERFSFRSSFGHRQLALWMKTEFPDELKRVRQILQRSSPSSALARTQVGPLEASAADAAPRASPHGIMGGTLVASESLIRELDPTTGKPLSPSPSAQRPRLLSGPVLPGPTGPRTLQGPPAAGATSPPRHLLPDDKLPRGVSRGGPFEAVRNSAPVSGTDPTAPTPLPDDGDELTAPIRKQDIEQAVASDLMKTVPAEAETDTQATRRPKFLMQFTPVPDLPAVSAEVVSDLLRTQPRQMKVVERGAEPAPLSTEKTDIVGAERGVVSRSRPRAALIVLGAVLVLALAIGIALFLALYPWEGDDRPSILADGGSLAASKRKSHVLSVSPASAGLECRIALQGLAPKPTPCRVEVEAGKTILFEVRQGSQTLFSETWTVTGDRELVVRPPPSKTR
jgi:serine/threonine protein kinase